MKNVKITAVRKTCYPDLMAKYENPIEHACDVEEGMTWVSVDGEKPENFCQSAWDSVASFVKTLANGGGNFYDGWMKNPYSAMISCNDGFRPVSFYIETMDNYDLQVDIAKRIFLQYDQELLIRKYCLEADGQYIYLTYLNTPCRIGRSDGGIEEFNEGAWQECRNFSTVMTVYDLLCYHKGDIAPPLAGQWCAVGKFVVTGVTDTETFTKKYAAIFDGHTEELKSACEKLGGAIQPRMAGADVTCKFQVTPFFPVLLQFWEGDEEFLPKLMLLWDRNTDQFMHFETTFYLQGDLMQRLWNNMKKQGK